ncbi:MAG: DegT/DnrJ/EryC1/StrS family aminotransferase [Planctomycetes bacterium]|nr:DegT/DnrJ/EryC1/StrS family aminotransferase [Planctomycetota bacterium]
MNPIGNPASPSTTRRRFLKTTGALAAGAALVRPGRARAAGEILALNGGPKAVTIPHADANRWPLYGKEEEDAVIALLRDPGYGPNATLEKEWQDYFKVPFVKSYCNGTSALTAMFFGLNLPPGSEIMVPSYTFFATIVPMRLFGLVPVFVDINPRTLNFDLDDAKKRLTANTKAVLPVHWFGNPCDMDAISEWAKERGLIVLEDCAHAHGTSLKGRLMGTWGEMSITSFQATKPLPGIEGGMGIYQKREHYERAATLGHYDVPRSFPADSPYRKYAVSGLGLKLRMHPVCAALARVQLKGLERRTAEGVAQTRSLNDRLIELPGLYEQKSRTDGKRLYYAQNTMFIDEAQAGMTREAVVKALQAEGVRARAYTYPLQHKLALYAEAQWWHHKPTIPELPGSEQANATAISLPYFTKAVPEVVEQYVKAFEKIWSHRKELARA